MISHTAIGLPLYHACRSIGLSAQRAYCVAKAPETWVIECINSAIADGVRLTVYQVLRDNWRLSTMKPTQPIRPLCAPRKSFKSREAAQAAGSRCGRLVETCPHCNGWHLA